MGTVFRAWDSHRQHDVALKVLPRALLHEKGFRERFENEARTIISLEHYAIVPVYDFGTENEQPFIAMRLMQGGSLADKLRDGPLSLSDSAEIMRRICSALDKAHSNGIIHRDLKPGNILFDEDNKAYLADFGIARLAEGTQTMTVIGTPQYMAPEQATGEPIDARTDVYQMGVVLFEMLTGRQPYDAPTAAALLYQHAHAPIPSARDLNGTLPPQCEIVVTNALAKEKQGRYPTTGDLALAVEALAQGRGVMPIGIVPPPPLPPTVLVEEPRKRGSWLWLIIGVVALLFVVGSGAVIMSQFGRNADPEPTLIAFPTETATAQATPEPTDSAESVKTPPPSTATPTPLPTATPAATTILSPTPTREVALFVDEPPTVAYTEPTGLIVYTCHVISIDQVCAINADGTGQRQLTNASATSWYASVAPGDNQILFSSRRDGAFGIYTSDPFGGGQRLLTPRSVNDYAPELSPDGTTIAFTRASGGNQNVWLMNSDGNNARALTNFEGDALDPTWSPDGTQIAFARREPDEESFTHHVINIDGTGLRRLKTPIERIGGRSDWSPDGQWLAFYAGERDSRQVYVVATDGSTVHQLTDSSSNLAPSFSPDGNWVVFASYRDGDGEVFIMRLDGSGLRQLTFNDIPDYQPRWSVP
jgi:serine/threonine-protein kinase